MKASQRPSDKVRVLIVDDQALFREGVLSLLWIDGVFEGLAAGTAEAVRLAQDFMPDAILLGLTPLAVDASSLAQALLAACPRSRLLLLENGAGSARTASVGGAQRCVSQTRQASFEEIVATIHSLAAR